MRVYEKSCAGVVKTLVIKTLVQHVGTPTQVSVTLSMCRAAMGKGFPSSSHHRQPLSLSPRAVSFSLPVTLQLPL